MPYAKPLFFVNNHKSHISEFYIFLKDPVCADQHVYPSGSQFADNLSLLGPGLKPAENPNFNGIRCHPLLKGLKMLFGQDRCGYKKSHLFSICYNLKCSSNRYLSLAETYVSTYETIHGLFRGQVV